MNFYGYDLQYKLSLFPSSGVTAAHIQINQDKDDVIRITGFVQGYMQRIPPDMASMYMKTRFQTMIA